MTKADSDLIRWLLHDSGESRYQISRDTGVAQSTLSRIVSEETNIDNMSFGVASKLTDHAKKLKTNSQ